MSEARFFTVFGGTKILWIHAQKFHFSNSARIGEPNDNTLIRSAYSSTAPTVDIGGEGAVPENCQIIAGIRPTAPQKAALTLRDDPRQSQAQPVVMAKLIVNVPGAPPSEIELKAGANRIGRSLNTDIQISHPSVSSVHCEIVDTNGALAVKDLGSTNGTFLDGQPVQEGPLQPGQTLRLGEVEISFAPELLARPALRVTLVETPVPSLPPAPRLAAPRPVRWEANFYKSIPGAFVFPFRRNGLILLASGTVFFVILNFLSGAAGIVGAGLGLFSCGYLFGFLQSIITTSAQGEAGMPGWPEFDSWLETGLGPLLQLVGIFAACFGPAVAYSLFAAHARVEVSAVLWIAGLLYLPMALLAVTMYDSLIALNPMLIVLSILRVPLEYAAACSVLVLLVLILAGSNWLDKNLKVPLLPSIVDEFLLLYILTVMARLAGSLFYATQRRLGWFMSQK